MVRKFAPGRFFWPGLSLFLWSLLLVAVLYGRALFLPFFFDDLDHLPYVGRTPLAAIWGSAGGFPYYRPLGATVWRLLFLLAGSHLAWLLHGVNLLLHAANGWLVGRLAGRLAADRGAAWGAATLFLVFPFSYQAVPWIGALYHLLVTFFALTAVLAALAYRSSRNRRWLMAGLAAAGLAPFAHENGVVVPLLVAAAFLTDSASAAQGRGGKAGTAASFPDRLRPAAVWLLAPAGGAAAWLSVPKGRAEPFGALNLEAIWQNSVYFLQGTAFPVTIAGGWLRDRWGWNDLWTAAGLGLGALLVTILLLRQQPSLRPAFHLGLIWTAAAAAPAVFALDFAYVISAPRLLMLPAAGIALIWGAAAAALSHRLSRPAGWTRAALTFALLLLLALPAGRFVWRQIDQHALLGRAWRSGVDAVAAANREGQAAILVNFPSSVTTVPTTFPLGHEGTVFMVPYIPTDRLVDVQTGRPQTVAFRRHDDIRPQMPYIYDVLGDGRDWPALATAYPAAEIWAARYAPEAITLEQLGAFGAGTDAPADAHFPDAGVFLGVPRAAWHDPETLEVALIWQAHEPAAGFNPNEYTVFVHALAADGSLAAQADGLALGNTFPVAQWPAAGAFLDRRRLRVPLDQIRPERLSIGLYSWETGDRLPITLAGGEQPADQALTIPLESGAAAGGPGE